MLKLFANARFVEGLARAKQLINQQKTLQEQDRLKSIAHQFVQKSNESNQALISTDGDGDRLIVKEKGQVRFIPHQDITWLEAYVYYVKIHLNNQFILIIDSLKNL